MKRSTLEERKVYCKEHGHSWIQVSYSSSRRCSWCEVYEAEEYNQRMDARDRAIKEGVDKPWLPIQPGE